MGDKEIGSLIAAVRRRQFPTVSQAAAAKLVGVSRGWFNKYEAGIAPVPYKVLRILAKEWNEPNLDPRTSVIIDDALPREGQLIYIGTLPAGEWELNTAEPSYENVPYEYSLDENNRAATISGDSMIPTLIPGDKIIIKTTPAPPPGKIVVVRSSEGEVTVKRYVLVSGKPMLVADNPNHPAVEARDCEFLGYVLALYSRQM